MPKCKQCGTHNSFLKLSRDGLCCACNVERLIDENEYFNIGKEFHCYLPNNYFFYIAVDNIYKKFALVVQSASKEFHISYYNFSDIIDFKMEKAYAHDGKCISLMISIFLNSLQRPAIIFYLINSPTTIGADGYNYAVHSASQIYGLLSYMKFNA